MSKREAPLRALTWLFSWLVPKDVREALLGDLAEEYDERAKAGSPSAALKWYLREIGASIPSLLWFRLTRTAWLSTLGIAVLAYLSVGVAQMIVRWAFASAFASGHSRLDV